jgi:P4 family phage/plasmid primase-like protien
MISESTFNYCVDFLYEHINPSITAELRNDDDSEKKGKVACLCEFFERYVYKSGMGKFLMSKSGVLHVYNGKFYEKVTTKTFMNEVVKNALGKMGVGLVYQKISNKKIAEECLSGMENNEKATFIPNRNYIVFTNGVLDLKSMKLREYSIDYKTDIVLDFDYEPSFRLGLWDAKITEIIPKNGMREAFQKFCGSLLVNRDEIKIEYMCFLLGPGSNGKSVVAKAISNVFGSDLFTKFSPKQLFKNNDAMFNLAALDGKLANLTDDLKDEDFSGGDFKSFVSGEEFQCRHPFGRTVFKVKAPMMLCCANAMPPTTDDSWGHHRRILPIYSTNRVFTEKDKDPMLSAKLSTQEARQAIFNWILEGYKMVMADGGNIKLDEEVLEAQQELRDDSNSARRWLRDNRLVRVVPSNAADTRWKSLTDWRTEYESYCKNNGYKPVGSKSLSKLFREKEFCEEHRRTGVWFCIGQLGYDTDDEGEAQAAPTPFEQAQKDADLPF